MCFKLSSKARHPCFGAKILTPSQWVSMNNPAAEYRKEDLPGTSPGIFTPAVTPNIYERPLTSQVFVPFELREDCLAAVTACLAARMFLDNDLFTPCQFLLSKLKRNCLACMSGEEGKEALADFHSCRSYIPQLMAENCELTCQLFNVTYSERAVQFFYNFLMENSFE